MSEITVYASRLVPPRLLFQCRSRLIRPVKSEPVRRNGEGGRLATRLNSIRLLLGHTAGELGPLTARTTRPSRPIERKHCRPGAQFPTVSQFNGCTRQGCTMAI